MINSAPPWPFLARGSSWGATEDNNGGSAYVYDLASAAPTVPLATLTNPSPAFYESFGSALAVSSTYVVVGASANSIGGRSTGSAYVYDLNSATPAVPGVTLNNPSPEEFEYFGTSVAISGTQVVVGAPDDNTGALHAGSAYVYDLARPVPTVPMPGFATISWTPMSSFVLQHTDSLAPTNWVNAASGAANPVTVPATNASRFYRLLRP